MVLRIKDVSKSERGIYYQTCGIGWDYQQYVEYRQRQNISNLWSYWSASPLLLKLRLQTFSPNEEISWPLLRRNGKYHRSTGKRIWLHTRKLWKPSKECRGVLRPTCSPTAACATRKRFYRPRKRVLSIEVSLFLFTYTTFIILPYYIYCRRRCRGTTYWFGLWDTCWQLLATSLLRPSFLHHCGVDGNSYWLYRIVLLQCKYTV